MGRGGAGLGMHIVHTIVTRVLRGQITVTSQVGVGTQVRVVFPSASCPTRVHHRHPVGIRLNPVGAAKMPICAPSPRCSCLERYQLDSICRHTSR